MTGGPVAARTFVDANVLVYAYDRQEPVKGAMARAVVRSLWESKAGALSTQVLQEFYVTVTRKIPRTIAKSDAIRLVSQYGTWHVHEIQVRDIRDASDLESREQISFWDALICVAASRSGAKRLLSEDLQAGNRYLGVTVENPFDTAS